jgi:N-acetylmuramoyl-L-alanine amidase
MVWRYSWATAFFGLLPSIAAPNSGIIQVTNVRSWSHADSTRVIIETTGPFEYRADRAQNPDRLFLDILHARPWIAHRRLATHEIGDQIVRRVRVAETAPGTTRVVFDLKMPADFKITRLDSPDRMVIEVRPVHPGNMVSEMPSGLVSIRRPFVYPPSARRRQLTLLALPPAFPIFEELQPINLTDPVLLFAAKPPKQTRASLPVVASTRAVAPPRPAPVNAMPMASENGSRSLTRALGLKVNRIVIDAGHGGHDDGTIGPHGVLEKDVVLDVSLRLSRLIQQRMGAEVVLTRSDDTFIPLHERTTIANEHHADLFLSIHANSSPAPEVAGTETFFLNFTNSPGALDVASRENAGSEKSVGELRDLIQSITMNDKIEESHTFAQDIQTSLQAQAARSNLAAHNRGVKRAPFVVLIGASMPSVLAEIGFLSNSRDESNLGKAEYRQKVAEALYKGLAQYAQSLSHFDAPVRQVARTSEKPVPAGLN